MYKKLKRVKCYCKQCFDSGIITEMYMDQKDPDLYKCNCVHKNYGRYFAMLKWCDSCQDFKYHRGFSIHSQCYACVMGKNSLKAIENGVHSSQNPETSLSNPKLHQLTVDNSIKNQTHCMMRPEIHAKATRSKLINYASGKAKCVKCDIKGVLNSFGLCSSCQREVAIEVNKAKYCP